ncbi:hypothetical protein ON010_g7573 [Phytophthora cinnamomi]|nr:hypothetical protein ON010_g7573 [Phytophthora cinnamomi]
MAMLRREPLCYGTMCEYWDDRAGMGTDPFFSSDATEIEEAIDFAAGFDMEETMETSDSSQTTSCQDARHRRPKQRDIKLAPWETLKAQTQAFSTLSQHFTNQSANLNNYTFARPSSR